MKTTKIFSVSLACLLALSAKAGTAIQPDPAKGKYFQVVMIWVKDPAKFQDYGQKVGPIVAKYGGNAERIISPVESFYGGTTAKEYEAPHMVNIVYYDDKEAYEAFEKDPEFLKIKHLRSESIEMAGIGGTVVDGELNLREVAARLYMIEFAYFSDEDGKKYQKYEKKTQAFSQRSGLHKERILKPDTKFGNIDLPDLVSIKFLDQASQKEQMESDKDHPKVEKLYGEAIRDLIWIEGKAAFVNLK